MTNAICTQHKKDCFAFFSGQCRALGDTNFKYECPFYKHTDDKYREWARIENDITNYKGLAKEAN